MQRALWLAKEEGIILAFRDLPNGYLGVYDAEPGEVPVIILATHLQFGSKAVLRSVLYEELGHHFTLRPLGVHHRCPAYAMKIHYSIQEKRALRWAGEHITHNSNWDEARSVTELAELWNVTEELADVIMTTQRQPRMICRCPLCLLGNHNTPNHFLKAVD